MELTEGVRERRSEIDKHIQRFAPAWPVGQLPAVERNILRLALYEMHYRSDTPRKVAINEAVELAKVFGAETSPKFVNGVLGSAMDQMENERCEVKGLDEAL
jgi:N utilization substance protein B